MFLWQQIEALRECHESHAYSKFWGKCNQQKWDLDACLRKEKSINRCRSLFVRACCEVFESTAILPDVRLLCRAANFAKSLEEKARLQKKLRSKRMEE